MSNHASPTSPSEILMVVIASGFTHTPSSKSGNRASIADSNGAIQSAKSGIIDTSRRQLISRKSKIRSTGEQFSANLTRRFIQSFVSRQSEERIISGDTNHPGYLPLSKRHRLISCITVTSSRPCSPLY